MDQDGTRHERRNEDGQIAADIARIRKDVDMILHGNGRKGLWALSDAVFGVPGKDDNGLLGKVKANSEARALARGMHEDVRDIRSKVDALEKARAKDENLREGSRRTLLILGAVLTALSGLGATFGYRVLQTLGEIATQIP